MEPFRFHIFVCTQQKPEGVPSCPAHGSFAVLEAFDREIQAQHLDHDVQLTTCGCMGLCDEGPVMVAYPEGVWYRRVKPADVTEIVSSHLISGKPVARLVWNDPAAMQSMAIDHTEKFRSAMAAREKAGILPDRLDQMIRPYMPARCVLTALELDLFTAIGEGATSQQIAKFAHADSRAVAMLANALVSLGLLTKSGDRYLNTPETSRFFTQSSKDNHRNGLLHIADIWHRWSTLTDAVRHGTRVPIDDDSPEWTRNFITAMQRNAEDRSVQFVKILGTSGVHRVLDLGGGSGAYSIAFATASPETHCDILDVTEVVPLTTDYINKAGVSSQVHVRTGDMLRDDLGSGYDLVLLNAICHMFSEDENRTLFRRARQALAPKGRLIVQDFILNPEKTGPQFATLFALNMLVSTEGGGTYTESDYASWMKSAGFDDVKRIDLPGPSSLIIGQVG